MEVKNLFEPAVKQDIINRIEKLTPETQRKWGKMDVGQMLAHCQMPLGVAVGKHKLKGNFFIKVIGKLVKKKLFNDEPFKQNLPTAGSFKMTTSKDFEKEKQALVQMIHDFSENTMSDEPHPFFGKLTKEEWSKGTWKHLDHHLQQFGV
ncbi:MAG: DUF1569 domain-containing protein [Ferruginibacter sp.]|nr:DUF1569 domain-containing protein [Chitinophagaceae bacterium]